MSKVVQFSRGSIIFFEGDKDENIYILQSGAVALRSMDLETGEQVSEQLHIGEFFGVKSALARMPSLVTASVLLDSIVVQFSVSEFEKMFGAKAVITEKMLRVFSKSLRDIHRKTEQYLGGSSISISPEHGMYMVAKAFYKGEQYKSCYDVLSRILKLNPDPLNKADVVKLLNDSNLRRGREISSGGSSEDALSDSESFAINQFSLPVFDRFTKKYRRGDVIISEYEPGETFYLIKYGEVQIEKCIKDQNKILDILGSGAFFGEMAILDNSQRSASCVARTDVACLEFNKENFKALVLGNPQIVMNLLKLFCKRIYDQYRQFKIVLIKDISVRICDVFLMYDELAGGNSRKRDDDGNSKRKFSVTSEDIASWASIPLDQAKSCLMRLMDRGKIQIFEDHIIVSNIHDMRRMVDSYYMKLESISKQPLI
ncbi:Crp/Fnr family transcriptional regulator [Treponema sp.]|uniref:Crp/Fnr family transcriptional regulator n=1 Tax=Treponema sp. TaxID=166 RepID=UPI003F0042A9